MAGKPTKYRGISWFETPPSRDIDARNLKAKREPQGVLLQARRYYFLMMIVLLIVFYGAAKGFAFLGVGQSVFHHYFEEPRGTLSACPDPSRSDTAVDVPRYVGVGADLAKKFADYSMGDNLYPNGNLTQLAADGYPASFERVQAVDDAQLQIDTDTDGARYLRSTVTGTSDEGNGRTWLPGFTPMMHGQSYHYSFRYRSGGADTNALVQYQLRNGTFSYESSTDLAPSQEWTTVEGRFNSANPDYISARLLITPKSGGQLDLKDFSIRALTNHSLSDGIVSVTFDDGRKNVFTQGRPILQKYGILTTQYVIADSSKNDPVDYMSLAQIRQLRKDGHEIESHSYRHCDQTRLSDTELEEDIRLTNALLAKSGLPTPKGFAYPYGAYDATTQRTLRKNFSYIRTSNDNYNDFYSDNTLIAVKPLDATVRTDEVQSWLDYAKTNHLWVVLLYHQIGGIGDYSTATSDFDAQMAAVKVSGLKVLTVEKALELLK